MKRKSLYILSFLIILLIYTGIFFKSKVILTACSEALFLFTNRLFPSIFPFFTLSSLVINMDYINHFKRFIPKVINKIFNISSDIFFIVLISLISGFPSGSIYISRYYLDKKIDRDTANYLLMWTHFANPLFVLGTAGILLKDLPLAYKIFFASILANFIIGIIMRPKEFTTIKKIEKTKRPSFITSLSLGINSSMDVLIFMLGSITIFKVFITLITTTFNFSSLTNSLISGFFDLTTGIESISFLNSNLLLTSSIILIFITFGSMSVHIQVINALLKTDLSYRYFFLGRIYQTIIALMLFIVGNL